jgi:lysophospholipase L1-like esterase
LQVRDLVAAQGTPFITLIIPDRRAVHPEDWSALLQAYAELRPELRQADPTAPNRRLEAFFTQHQIPTLDMTWMLRRWAEGSLSERLYFRDDGHLTAKGHQVIADRLATWVGKQMKEALRRK